ncbi:MAG: sigma-70 family RNA polymerase sigma factor [Clostridia bacterium]|nr:sigma-70 family RNA polymerase sigma factor [Clostridia bacterium]
MDDLTIIRLLHERSEEGLVHLKDKYSRLYKGVLNGILGETADIEECENDVLLAVWNTIPPNSPHYLSSYICRIARNIGINRYKSNTRQKRGAGECDVMLSELEDCIPDSFGDHMYDQMEWGQRVNFMLDSFLRGLDAEVRVLFIRRYIFAESVRSLSQRYDIGEKQIALKLFRARKKLKKMLEKEDIYV